MDTEISHTHLSVTADIEVDRTSEPPPPTPIESDTVRLGGRVVQQRTGTGLSGLRVVAAALGETYTTLGTGVTNADGRFEIQFEDSPQVSERLTVLRHMAAARASLRVETADGRELATSEPFPLDRPTVETTVPVSLPPATVTAKDWAALGSALQSRRVAHLGDVARLLNEEGDGAGLDGVPMLTRQAMLEQMEQAFLDPTRALRQAVGAAPTLQEMHDPELAAAYQKKVEASDRPEVAAAFADLLGRAGRFASLDAVDWVLDPAPLLHGNPEEALNRFADHYRLGDRLGHLFFRESDLIGYRDYLVAIWTTFAPRIEYVQGVKLSASDALQQIATRFHQDFQTQDDAPVNANTVVARILTEILTAPTGGGFGFAVPVASIPAQGTKTPRAYLDELIALAGHSATELGLRYRIDFTRRDTERSSPVQENIAALQGFFRDSFQCEAEPFHVAPDPHDQPIIPDILQGDAPFFLYFDEWLRQRAPFYPENHLDVRRMLPVAISPEARNTLNDLAAGKFPAEAANVKLWKFCQRVVAIWDKLQEGHAHYYQGEFALARVDYQNAAAIALSAMQDNILQGNVPTALVKLRNTLPLKSVKDIPRFSNPSELYASGFGSFPTAPDWARDRMGLRLAYYALVTIPVCLGDTELALGDYEQAVFHYGQATRFAVGVARESDSGGYRPHYLATFGMYFKGDKPYTVDLLRGFRMADGFHSFGPNDSRYPLEESEEAYDQYYDTTTQSAVEQFAVQWSLRIPRVAEKNLFRLKQANAMLEWADALYRENEATPMARARELYKGVLWLHGRTPDICPQWSVGFGLGALPPFYFHHVENPALLSQTGRAERGIYQIEHGLNYFGERDDVVPILRYRALKDTADRMAAMARGAQQDFVQFTQQVEAAITARLQLANFLQKAKMQVSIADESTAIAQHDVQVAQDQVAAVQAAIKAKQDEIAQADSFFGQIGEAFKSIKGMIGDLPDSTKSAVSAGIVSEATGSQMVGEGMLGLGAGASVMTGIGIFAVVGYVTLSGMADAANKRSADLHTLMDKALPGAEAAVEARKHGVNITRLQRGIAQADVDLAQTLLAFEQNRTLNLNFWNEMAQIARRLLRRYLEMGARVSWLAERALAYEQDRSLRIVRMDYFPARLQGVSGADLMAADLAELEATRIEGMKRTVPVRRTLSLARDFPMQYGQLKKTGRCAFRTEEIVFRRPHPGTGGYRLRAVSATVQQMNMTQPLRGSLINFGVSISKPQQPGEHVLVRPADSLPISEFRLEQDMALYGLPGETLLTFEGSSAESFWELSFPPAANAAGLDGLADVLLTFDLFAEFAPDQYGADIAALPSKARRWILVSAAQYAPQAIAALAGAASSVDVAYDMRRVKLPRQEKTRKVKNVALMTIAATDFDFKTKLASATPATSVGVDLKGGFAISSLQPDPLLPPLPPSPLNAFADQDPEQTFTLSISKAANPAVDFSRVTDVVLGLEYEASLV